MENASKALIIAGAILLAILIISLGIMIYRQASGVVDSNAMDEVAVSSFNEKFQQYVGDNVRGANVNALITSIVQNNLSNSGDTSKQISITFGSARSTSNWSKSVATTLTRPTSTNTTGQALTGKSYKVETTPDEKSGYITTVTISDAT